MSSFPLVSYSAAVGTHSRAIRNGFSLIRLLFACAFLSLEAQGEGYVRLVAEIQVTNAIWETTGTHVGETNVWPVMTVVCIVGTNAWLLDGNLSSNGRNKWYYDGRTLFSSAQIVKEPPADVANDKEFGWLSPPLAKVGSNLTIHVFDVPGDYGYPGGVSAHIPWLAFCSGPYLGRNGRRIPIPTLMSVASVELSGSQLSCVDDTTTFKDELGLPLSVDLYCDNLTVSGNTGTTSSVENRRRRFHYVVTASTNYAGWNFPLRFEFGDDIPETGVGSETRRNIQGSGRLISISDSPRPEGVFDSKLRQTVVDWRFSSPIEAVRGIIYETTNCYLLPTNDPGLQSIFEKKLSSAREIKSHQTEAEKK